MNAGQLGKQDFINENEKADGLKIVPFNENIDLKQASYDITPTIIAMSSKLGLLETVYRDKDEPSNYYIMVKPRDSVLVVSKEYFEVPSDIAGYVVSRLSKVAEGFGHISTSIDPNWKGALLIGLSNPTNKALKVYVGGERADSAKGFALATVSFHYLNIPCNSQPPDEDFKGMRLDLLNQIQYSKRAGIKAWLNRLIHFKRRKFTDAFFRYIRGRVISIDNWEGTAKTLCGEPADNVFAKYIVKEDTAHRFLRWLKEHWKAAILFVAALLCLAGAVSDEAKEKITEVLEAFFKLF